MGPWFAVPRHIAMSSAETLPGDVLVRRTASGRRGGVAWKALSASCTLPICAGTRRHHGPMGWTGRKALASLAENVKELASVWLATLGKRAARQFMNHSMRMGASHLQPALRFRSYIV